MAIRYFLLIGVFVVFAISQDVTIKTGSDKKVKFVKDTKSRANGENVYYRNGKRDFANRFVSKGQIIVALKNINNIKQVEENYGLKYVRTVLKDKNLYLFKNVSGLDDGSLCEKMGNDDLVIYAYPNWEIKKTLY